MSNETQSPKKNKEGMLYGIIALLVVIIGVLVWINVSHKEEIEEKTIMIDDAKKEFENLTGVKKQLDSKIDSLDFSNSQMKFELESKAVEIEEKEKEIKSLLSKQKRNLSEIATLKEKMAEFKSLLADRDEQIAILMKENSELKKSNEVLNTTVSTMGTNIKTLETEKEDLYAKGSILVVQKITLTAINKSGKERLGAYFRLRHLDRLKICFQIGDNKVSKPGPKSIYIRVIDPSGACLPQTNGTNVFTLEGNPVLYTIKHDFNFDNSGEKMCITWKNEQGFMPGTHQLLLYSEGVLVGEEKLLIKKNLF